MNSLTPPSSIDKDHHESENLYKKALLNEINSLSDSGIDQSPIIKKKSSSRSKIDSDSLMKSGSSKLKNKISPYFKSDESFQKMDAKANFRSPKTISKTNSPFNHGNSLSPSPSPISSAKSPTSSQLLAGNIITSHSRSPSNLSCNTSRTRYFSIQLPKDANKSDAYHGTIDEYSKKNERRYDNMEINDNFFMHTYAQAQSFLSHSHHDKKDKDSSRKKATSPLGKGSKFLGEESKMKMLFKYCNRMKNQY